MLPWKKYKNFEFIIFIIQSKTFYFKKQRYVHKNTNIYINIKLINIRLKSNTFMENILDIEYMINSEGYNYLYIEIDKLSKI